VVNFQKSQWGSRLETKFTINLGVALDRLAFVNGRDPLKKPPVYRCEWGARIGQATENREDRWWRLDQETDITWLSSEVVPLLIDRGLPLIEERLTEAGFLAATRTNPHIGHVIKLPQVIAVLDQGRSSEEST